MTRPFAEGRNAAFVAVFLALVLCLVPSAAQQSSNWTVDVAGIVLGSSSIAAIDATNAHNARFRMEFAPAVRFDALPNVDFVENARALESRPNGGQESIILDLSLPPNSPTVWRIARTVNYVDAERPTVASIINDLRQKYGREDGSLQSPQAAAALGVPMVDAYWVFTQKGVRLPKAQAASLATNCMNLWESGAYLAQLRLPPNPNLFTPRNISCGVSIAIHAIWQPTPPNVKPVGLVERFRITAIDGALFRSSYTASEGLLKKR